MKGWISSNIVGKGSWSSTFGYTVWYIWKQRNALIFKGEQDNVEKTVRLISAAVDSNRVARSGGLVPVRAVPRALAGWIPPPAGWYKLNSDGASRGNPGEAGCGGIIRDSGGSLRSAFHCYLGHCSAARAELFGVLHGVQIAKALQLTHLLVEVDATLIHKALSEELPQSHADFYLLSQCHDLIRAPDWEVRIVCTSRQNNKVADSLANFSLSCTSGLITMTVLPPLSDVFFQEDIAHMGSMASA